MGRLMLAAKLRHRVTIEEFIEVQDSDGARETSWVTLLSDYPAEIVPLSGREFTAAAAIQAGITTRITVRYDGDIAAAMRVVHGADIYNIKAVLPDPTLRRHLTLMCQQGVNLG
jgi:SPP1 family predicted phage head-tail adaptor